jgi:DNA-binding beta-propeller fold protein YncE
MRVSTPIIIFVVLLLLAGCGKDTKIIHQTGSVIVLNEGGFGHGTASVSLYDPAAKTVTNDVFHTTNGFMMGDVAQSLYQQDSIAYIVMNNSAKILRVNTARNFRYISSISIRGSSPRFFMPVTSHKAYVTELYANKIWVVDQTSDSVIGSIPVSGWTEDITTYGNHAYVLQKTAPTGAASHKVLQIDINDDRVINSIDLTSDPSSMVLVDEHHLYVMTAAQTTGSRVNAALYLIDPTSFTVTRRMEFAAGHTPGYIRYSTYTHQLLFADNGICKMDISDTVPAVTPFIPSNGWNVYGLNADPNNGDIYVCDAIDYQQASRIMRYSKEGQSIDAFHAGIITNGCYFK